MTQRSPTIPLLPCRSLDEAIPFHEAPGFTRTYRQDRPNSGLYTSPVGMGLTDQRKDESHGI